MCGVLGYGQSLKTTHRDCNLLNPGHDPLPLQQQADVLNDQVAQH